MNHPVDTLVCDTARIAAWQQDSAFDYNRELIEPQQTILQWLYEVIIGFLSEVINSALGYDVSWVRFAVIGILLIGVVGWLVYKFRPGIFGRGKKDSLDYELEDDTIYGIDFEAAISAALERQDYREAVRLRYLQTLKLLTEAEKIDWQLHKTPTQYTYEFADEAFLKMTRHFLRIRYGNFEATPEIYEEMTASFLNLKSQTSNLKSQEKGGDA